MALLGRFPGTSAESQSGVFAATLHKWAAARKEYPERDRGASIVPLAPLHLIGRKADPTWDQGRTREGGGGAGIVAAAARAESSWL